MTGTLEHLGGDRWKVRMYAGLDPRGRQRQRSRTFRAPNERAARKQADKVRAALNDEIEAAEATKGTVAELATEWLALKRRRCAPTTIHQYEQLARSVIAEFGDLPVAQLNGRRIDAWYGHLEERGLSASTVGHYHAALRGMLRQGAKWDMVAKIVTEQASPPPAAAEEVVPPTTTALNVLIDSAGGDLAVIARTIAATGMRRGEVLALSRSCLAGTKLRIWRAIAEVQGQPPIVKETKGKRARTIVIDPATADMLRAHFAVVDQRAADREATVVRDPWLFPDQVTDPTGATPHYPSWLSHRWDTHRRDAPIGLHSIRHWHATMLIDAGVAVTVVSERLGHAQVSTTMNIYAHALKARDEQSAEVIVNLLNGGGLPAPVLPRGQTS